MFFWSHRVTLLFEAYFFFCEKFTSCSSRNWDRSFFCQGLMLSSDLSSLTSSIFFWTEFLYFKLCPIKVEGARNTVLSRIWSLSLRSSSVSCHRFSRPFWSASRREPRNPKCQYIPKGLIYRNCDDLNFIAWKIIEIKF